MDSPISIDGASPELSMTAGSSTPRTECGIGALMPWADKLWAVTYPSSGAGSGTGTGLYEIDEDLSMERHPESVVGTYANRMVHSESDQMIIGPHIIDADGGVRTFEALAHSEGLPYEERIRLTATMEHLENPEEFVYFLSMEGYLYEANVHTLEVAPLFDLNDELSITDIPHFKGGYTGHGRVIVANNSYDEAEHTGEKARGRLAEWDGEEWRIVEKHPFMDVAERPNLAGEEGVIFATGWDNRSAILKVFTDGEWSTYRLPKASHAYDHMWLTEWTRIREVEHVRFLVDCHGLFYELAPLAYDGKTWGIDPICKHLRVVPDFTSFRGSLVLAGDQVTAANDNNVTAGQPQSGLWFGKTDDLWEFGKPKGWGGPWREDDVSAGDPSDPYLMTGFDEKTLHISHEADQTVTFDVEVDFLGDHSWELYGTLSVDADGYTHHEFPGGFSAHWVRLVPDDDCTATGYFTYS